MLTVDIEKKLHNFLLCPQFKSTAKTIAILGESGSGKSMTLKSIAGIETPDKGMVAYNDRVMFDKSRRINLKPQKRNIGYLFQDYALFPNMTAKENICCTAANDKEASEIIRRIGIDEYANIKSGCLSGGQQQRVALARCIVTHPCILLLDEPFSALDTFVKDKLRLEVKELLDAFGIQTIIVTHDCNEAYALCQETMIMHRGKVIEKGDTKSVFAKPTTAVTARITGCKNIYSVKKVSDNEVYVPELGVCLKVTGDIRKYIGIQSGDLICAENTVINSFKIKIKNITVSRFTYDVTVFTESGGEIILTLKKDSMDLKKLHEINYLSVNPDDILNLQ